LTVNNRKRNWDEENKRGRNTILDDRCWILDTGWDKAKGKMKIVRSE